MFITPGSRKKSGGSFPRSTVMVFYNATAPLGWTKLTTQNDKAFRVVSGTGGVAGGTNSFSTVFAQTVVGNTSLSIAQLASHNHLPTQRSGSASTQTGDGFANGGIDAVSGAVTGSTGSTTTHNHTITMSIQFVDVILCSKN